MSSTDFNSIDVTQCKIEDIPKVSECTRRMIEISEKHINDKDINARHLSDLMHRFADKINELNNDNYISESQLQYSLRKLDQLLLMLTTLVATNDIEPFKEMRELLVDALSSIKMKLNKR